MSSGTTTDGHSSSSQRREGVASPEELKAFVEKSGDALVVIDLRNPSAEEDVKSIEKTAVPNGDNRPRAVNLPWDRDSHSMTLPDVPSKDTPIITHCGAGGRGQMAKEFLEAHGFTNVVNGGGPREKDCWETYGHL